VCCSRVTGDKLHITTLGDGPGLVLIHGWGLHGGLFAPLLPCLMPHHRLYLVDLPGHGQSRGELPLTIDATVDAIAGQVPAALPWLGWSLGGLIALYGASRTGLVSRLILTGTSPCFCQRDDWHRAMPTTIFNQFAAALAADYSATLHRFIALQSQGAESSREILRHMRQQIAAVAEPDPAALQSGLAILQQHDARPLLNRLKLPLLILHGERDTLVPLAAAAAMAEQLPSAEFVAFRRAGHAPFMSDSAEFCQRLLTFLASDRA
jgi:pimeloyl-[acyl-carrier protein] methyl ester esterase